MSDIHDAIRQHMEEGYTQIAVCKGQQIGFVDLRKSEWSPKFEELMRNRLIVGFYRYGAFGKQNRTTEEMMTSIAKKVDKYIETGNDEYLVDIANLAMKEFAAGKHPNKHFKATDDEEHT